MDIVEILWEDACSGGGWQPAVELRTKVDLLPCRTVGYILHRTKKFVSVVQSIGETNGYASETMTIPLSNVKKIRKLK